MEHDRRTKPDDSVITAAHRGGPGVGLALMLMVCLGLAGCPRFPSPGAAMPPLDKGEAAELAGCQQALHKAQAAFAKVKVKSLHKCLQGVLSPTVAFENAVMTQAKYDAAIDAARARCTKGYDKIAAASTRMVDAILAACAPVEQLLVGVYDGLRMQALAEGSVDSLVEIAGFVCTGTEAALDAQIVLATPRMVELLDILGPGFLQASSVLGEGGYPAVPLDPRCPPIESLGGMLPSP